MKAPMSVAPERTQSSRPARVKATYARLTLSWISALWQALQKSAKGEMPLRQSTAIDHCNSADPSVGAFVDAYNRNAHRWAIQASADTAEHVVA